MEYGYAVLMVAFSLGIIIFALLMPGSLDLMWQATYRSIRNEKKVLLPSLLW